MIISDMQLIDESVEVEDFRTALLLEFSDVLFEIMLSEAARDVRQLGGLAR
jgi:hypothetical protein